MVFATFADSWLPPTRIQLHINLKIFSPLQALLQDVPVFVWQLQYGTLTLGLLKRIIFLKSKGHAQNTDDSQYHILDVSHFLGTAKPIIKGDLLILHHRSSTAITATQEKLRVGRSDFFADYSSKKVSSYSGDKLSP